jgi:hypothetical protein
MVGGIDRAPPGACFWDADNGGPKNSSRYQCGVGGEGLQNPKVVCHSNWNGHAYNCDFEVDVVDQSMSVSEFKMRYW